MLFSNSQIYHEASNNVSLNYNWNHTTVLSFHRRHSVWSALRGGVSFNFGCTIQISSTARWRISAFNFAASYWVNAPTIASRAVKLCDSKIAFFIAGRCIPTNESWFWQGIGPLRQTCWAFKFLLSVQFFSVPLTSFPSSGTTQRHFRPSGPRRMHCVSLYHPEFVQPNWYCTALSADVVFVKLFCASSCLKHGAFW